jgi:lactoylglutathione lyase
MRHKGLRIMQLEHFAIWTSQLDVLKDFYEKYFGGRAGAKYVDSTGRFSSYFITFPTGAKLEIMQLPEVQPRQHDQRYPVSGYTHMAFRVNTPDEVKILTQLLCQDGFKLEKPLQWTADGFYESAVFDPDQNIVEITCQVGESSANKGERIC